MPPRSLRQWHCLRLVSAVPLAQLNPQWHSFAAVTRGVAPARFQSTQHCPIESFRRIIIPNTTSIAPEALICGLPVLKRSLQNSGRRATLLFFLTPAFAKWLNDEDTFLQKAIAHVCQEPQAPQRIKAVVAVVDKLPAPRHVQRVERGPPVAKLAPGVDIGHEGLACAVLPDSNLRYVTRTSPDEQASIVVGPLGSQALDSFGETLSIPLANTVFQTGTPTTMTLSYWERQCDQAYYRIVENGKKDLARLHLTLGDETSNERKPRPLLRHAQLDIPLIPLTLPRRVDAVMGNIIRRVIEPSEDGQGEQSIPASKELEEVVPRYLESRNEPSQTMSVWALVIPEGQVNMVTKQTTQHHLDGVSEHDEKGIWDQRWRNSWGPDISSWNDQVSVALKNGARLHRVLSGGGGWGKKAGLLSLDPSAVSDGASASSSAGPPGLFDFDDDAEDLSSALGQVVNPGDHIQFYASPINTPAVPDTQCQIDSLMQLSKGMIPWSWELGTVPSTADAAEALSWQHNPTLSTQSASHGLVIFKNTFGALSEGGMTIKRSDKEVSKVDVPYSRFSSAILRPGDLKPIEDQVMRTDGDEKGSVEQRANVRSTEQ